ncbi:hypothetical protein SAY86_013784 [Trapa natans]|uniref:ABC transporter domain-containing protein n=1 Tax=Trapa natans TaxID=22666 RepID=A0AAN7QM51_TRANT|nr:hypothetical protein SAY86_013784 [Trapa natans]
MLRFVSSDKLKFFDLKTIILFSFLVASSLSWGQCQDTSVLDNPVMIPFLTQMVANLTNDLGQEISNRSSFCVEDPSDDWNRAFNFSSNMDFLIDCMQKNNGDIGQKLCTVAEVKFYFNYLMEVSLSSNYLKPNRNCNLTTWVPGCEPGWACGLGANEAVDIREANIIPERTQSCGTCCQGFFCPRGLTCMIPCPLGSYCPLATLNTATGLCEPYTYQLPPGQTNHTCGGANMWADVGRSHDIFCPSGSYCPTTVQSHPCGSGRFCRMGSTSEKPCYKLVSCDANSSTQNIKTYGILLIVVVITMLFIIYSCSDQLISIQTRRQAKSREVAAKRARETARARQRWNAAKDAAKRHIIEISGSFSHRHNSVDSEESSILKQESRPSVDDSALSPIHQAGSVPRQSTGNKKEQIVKDIHSRSQIFKYAYSQLEMEKERALENGNSINISGVISMATNPGVIKRPLIEVSFKDLTLILKGKNKHLLRCITGTLKPGRITAVMGPSGAGKTSFLSALAGKAMGCSMTGVIMINGKKESIHSYKKITGFVPQDDIVHGNLTVGENLWFSATCRLAANMPKAEKVLIVERVVQSLGLQSVRDSLVGTVEKRGISGGQRKRVNVGLEMVMEPSLLILDEPTSGLDSSSSQLLMRALRHEALEGVNICMVVHQPSYALFQMFNDLILLARGGFIVYHGPVKNVEEYFSGIGINVPDRVNPPDHFIDFLEGIIMTPGTSTGVIHSELPIRWMIHNGFAVPPDMRADARALLSNETALAATAAGISAVNMGTAEQSFAGDLWQDVRSTMERQRDKLRLNFFKSEDLSNRTTPNLLAQYRYFLGRIGKQRLRDAKAQAVDFLILLLAGASLGTLAKASDESFGATGYTYTIIAVSLLCKVAALRSFSLDKLQHWRESASGMSTLAYFLAKDTIDHFNTVIKPMVYLAMFYFFTTPRSTFLDNYIVLLCLVYCVTGIGYVLAIFFEASAAQLWSVLLPVIMTLVATRPKTGFVKMLSNFCYPKWALEAFVIANAKKYYGVWLITRCGALMKSNYDIRDFNTCIMVIIFTGIISRIIAYFGLLIFQKK